MFVFYLLYTTPKVNKSGVSLRFSHFSDTFGLQYMRDVFYRLRRRILFEIYLRGENDGKN